MKETAISDKFHERFARLLFFPKTIQSLIRPPSGRKISEFKQWRINLERA